MGEVWGIARVKDEADIIEATVRRMALQVDRLLVADNASTDGTRDILATLAESLPLEIIDDTDVAYYQSAKMTDLAARAAAAGAGWVIPFDADEIWYSPFGRICDVLAEHPRAAVADAELYDHVPTADDPDTRDPCERIGWRRRAATPLRKVAARPLVPVTIHQGNHAADHGHRVEGLLVVRHYPYRTPEQMIRKARNGAAAYAATDLPEDTGAHWRGYGRLSDEAIGDVFRRYFWSPSPASDPALIFDPCPL